MFTATKTGKGFSNGQVWVCVLFTDGVEKFETVYRADTISPDWPDAQMRSRLAQLNALDLTTIKLGAADPAPVVVVVPPTQAAYVFTPSGAVTLDQQGAGGTGYTAAGIALVSATPVASGTTVILYASN